MISSNNAPFHFTRFRHLSMALAVVMAVASTAFGQRDLKNIPPPDSELERKTFIVPDGFEVNLFASDPRIAKPIQMNFDANGRLWIASSSVYPHIKPGQPAFGQDPCARRQRPRRRCGRDGRVRRRVVDPNGRPPG